jgi:hypothetical protein
MQTRACVSVLPSFGVNFGKQFIADRKTKFMNKLLCVLSLMAVAAPVAAQQGIHCLPEEEVVFACSFGKKAVSVCASATQTANEGYMQYRFGAPGQVEMEYPSSKVHPNGRFDAFYGTPMMDDGSRAMFVELTFDVNDYRYELSTLASDSSSDSTLTVYKADKALVTMQCEPASVVNPSFSYMTVLTAFGF